MKIVIEVCSEWPGVNGSAVDREEIDPEEWAKLDQRGRDDLCDEIAADLFHGYCNYGWVIEETED